MLEKDIEKKITDGIRNIHGKAYKFTSPGNVGVPDRLVVLPGGRVIFVELKTETGRLSPMQYRQIDTLQHLGADVRVLYGLDQVKEFLQEVSEFEP